MRQAGILSLAVVAIVTMLVAASPTRLDRNSAVTGVSAAPAGTPPVALHPGHKVNQSQPLAAAVQRYQAATANQASPTVDGARNPELIPDHVALRHLIEALSVHHENAPAIATKRREIYMKRIQLSAADQNGVVKALRLLRSRLDDVHRRRASLGHIESEREGIVASERDLFRNAREQLQQNISDQGMAALIRFAREHVKPRIRMYGSIPSDESF